MSRRAMIGGWLLGLLAVGCANDDGGDDGPGQTASSSTGANPSNSGTAATGTTPTVGIAGANTGSAGRGGAAGGSAGESAAGAAGEDDQGNAGGGAANAGGGAGSASNAGGSASNAGGGAGNAGGNAGTGIPGMGGTDGNGNCDLVCPVGTRCELADVTCIRAPCNPVPMCVAAGMGGRGGNGSGGSSGTEGSGNGAICGTRGAPPCASGEFCNHPIGADCGRADAPGTCEAMPRGCTREYQPVCGCDGRTYGNACSAASEGVSIERDGEC